MKTVSGKVIATDPISLSKAASILSKFASAENGASQAVSAYLRRACAAFNEVKSLHKELKSSSKSHSEGKRSKSDVTHEPDPTRTGEEPGGHAEMSRGPSCYSEDENEGRKRKTKEKERGEAGNLAESGGEAGIRGEEKPSRTSQENERKEHKKKKKRNKDEDENGVEMETEGGKNQERKKKRKIEAEMGSEERKSKKKKRKSEGDG